MKSDLEPPTLEREWKRNRRVGITGWKGVKNDDDGGTSLGEEAIKKWWVPDGAVRVRVRESKGVAVCLFFLPWTFFLTFLLSISFCLFCRHLITL